MNDREPTCHFDHIWRFWVFQFDSVTRSGDVVRMQIAARLCSAYRALSA